MDKYVNIGIKRVYTADARTVFDNNLKNVSERKVLLTKPARTENR